MSEELLTEWRDRARESQHSHHEAAKSLLRIHRYMGLIIVVATVFLSGTWWLEFFSTEIPKIWKLVLAVLSLVVASISAIQTFSKYAETSEKHQSLGARYGSLRRDLEQVLAVSKFDELDISRIRRDLDKLSIEGPVVPTKIHLRTIKELKSKDAR